MRCHEQSLASNFLRQSPALSKPPYQTWGNPLTGRKLRKDFRGTKDNEEWKKILKKETTSERL